MCVERLPWRLGELICCLCLRSGHLGLWLDAGLDRGTTTRCATFNNQPLSARRDFNVHSLEVWSFQ